MDDKIKCVACGDTCKDEPLVMHGRCHISSPTYAVKMGDKLAIYCATCDKLIAPFRVKEIVADSPLDPVCHPEAETWAILSHDQKTLAITCAVCDVEVSKFEFFGVWREIQ